MLEQQLIKFLDIENTDYWSDYGSDMARKLIDENTDQIFTLILSEWRKWPKIRQEHLAYILGEGYSNKEFELIKEMMSSEYNDVVYHAKEALIDFNQRT